jgi:DNA-binding response OmpR family regulator
MKANILLVEDEENFGQVLKSYLELADYSVALATDGDVGYARFKSGSFDLCIFDVMMPKRDGFTLAQDVRKLNARIPIIFLTARGEKEDQVKGYQSGADDYLTKPFDSELLLLKIEVILSRFQAKPGKIEVVDIGAFQFNRSRRELLKDGKMTRLSPKENDLLTMLYHYKNDVMPRSEALLKIWKNEDYFTTRSMDVYVAKLRKKLQADPSIRIENIHGEGYILHCQDSGGSV